MSDDINIELTEPDNINIELSEDIINIELTAEGPQGPSGAGGGAFTGLTDTPSSYAGQAGKYTKVNAGATGLEFDTPAGSGDMEKATYDTDDDGIVDKAETVDDGTYSSTAADVKDAVDKKHTHANKTTLDAIEEAFTTALKTSYDGAVTDEHTHSNKAELDLVTDGDHDVRTDNPHSVTKTQVGLGSVDDKSEATIIADVKADADVADAITKKHTQGTDTTLGTQAQDLDMGTHKIIHVVNPVSAQDAATKDYVDTSGGSISGSGTAGKITKWTDVSAIGDATNTDTEVADAVTKKHTQNSDTKLQDGAATPIDSVVVNTGGIVDLPKQSGCRVERATAQSIPDATDTVVKYNTEDWDIQNEWDSTTNFRFTALTAGKYSVMGILGTASVAWDAREMLKLQIFKNSSLYASGVREKADAAVSTTFESIVATLVDMVIGDYIDFRVKHTRGASTDTSPAAKYNYCSILKEV